MKINDQNRDEIQSRYVETMVDAMDVDALIAFARSTLEAECKPLSNEELEDTIEANLEYFDWDGEDNG